MTENEMVGWHHQLNGHGFGWTLGVGDGQGGLAFCGSWGCKELYTAERLIYNSFIFRPTLISLHDYWTNHSFDYTDLCWQSNVSAF